MHSFLSGVNRALARLRGAPAVFDLGPLRSRQVAIESAGDKLRQCDDAGLRAAASDLRERAGGGAAVDGLEVEAFALVREAAGRVLDMRPYDVQLLAGLALTRGKLIEMQTGEGKTLAAVFPAFVHALGGRGVHVLTFNDYLARRDAAWMGPLYRFLGLSVGVVQEAMARAERRTAYAADVIYVTAKEAGFDLLRDGLCDTAVDTVRRPYHFAIVDEADSLLIDEARVPLVIAGSAEPSEDRSRRFADVVRHLEPDVHYATDEYSRNVDLTEAGLARTESLLGCGDLLSEANVAAYTELNCALHAAVLVHRDVDYILKDGKIQLVDEFTGRVVEDRHWPDGLQAALEAKENLARRTEGRILGSLTLQHFLLHYPGLCGMTGTARPAAGEFHEFYDLDVVVIPPNRPCVRRDLTDVVFTHLDAKLRAVVQEISAVHATGRPILVGTASVAESERIACALRDVSVPCRLLNARNDEREAVVIASAGAPGAVTISTNMAGRGTDIKLGGPHEEERDRVVALGGLYVLGTNRHESVRIDQQLRGRAGRQGDPGSSRFFVSLEDDLIVRYGIDRLIPPKLWPARQDLPIDDLVIRREIARAQRIVEGQNLDIRRTLKKYADPIESRREIVEAWRNDVLTRMPETCGRDLAELQATRFHLDRRFAEHLGRVADLREGIHLLRIGGQDPLAEFVSRTSEWFRDMREVIPADVAATLATSAIGERGLDLDREGLRGPSSTWTYLVNDDPFRDQLGIQLAGNTGFAAAAALYAGPILILWGLYNRYLRRRGKSDRD